MANGPYNISTVGSKVTVAGIEITDFADDSDPFTVTEKAVGDTSMTIKNTLLFYNKHEGTRIDISVIADSQSDMKLYQKSNEGEYDDNGFEITISQKGGKTWTFKNCFPLNQHAGFSSSQDGRKKSKTYSFVSQESSAQSAQEQSNNPVYARNTTGGFTSSNYA